jgi:hypothetical protein
MHMNSVRIHLCMTILLRVIFKNEKSKQEVCAINIVFWPSKLSSAIINKRETADASSLFMYNGIVRNVRQQKTPSNLNEPW